MEVTVPHWVRGEAEFAVARAVAAAHADAGTRGQRGHARRRHRGRSRHGQGHRGAESAARGRRAKTESCSSAIAWSARATARATDRAVTMRVQARRPRQRSARRGVVIRSVSTSDERFPHTGAMRYSADAPRIPAFAISNPDADALERQFASGKPVRLRMSQQLARTGAGDFGQRHRRNSGHRPRQRDRDSRRPPRLLGSGRRRHRRWRGRGHHDERREAHQRARTASRGARFAWCCSPTRNSAPPARRPTSTANQARSAGMCWASKRTSAPDRCGAYLVA